MDEPTEIITFADLFDGLGTPALCYGGRAAALDGRWVAIAGVLEPVHGDAGRFVLIERPGSCPDCSPLPLAAITLPNLAEVPPAARPGVTEVMVQGRLGFGFEIDARGEASFLRLEEAAVYLPE